MSRLHVHNQASALGHAITDLGSTLTNAALRRSDGLPVPRLTVQGPCEERRRALVDFGYGVGVDPEGGGAAAAVAEAVGGVAEVDSCGQELGGAVVA